ncbi:hypothetical protein ABFS82_06G019300 [Erythranthe guttata]
MSTRIKGSLVFLFFLLMFLLSSGIINLYGVGTNPLHLLPEGEVRAKTRKLMGFVQVLDYDYAGPNPKHDPRGKRGGGGGGGSKNP